MTEAIQDSLALRLGMAAKAVPQLSLQLFVQNLVKELGEPLNEKKLRSLSPKKFYQFMIGLNSDIERGQSNQALAILTSESISSMQAPVISETPPLTGPVLKIAVTSNNEEMIDGHFGSCLRILIYEANSERFRLTDVREVETQESGMNRTDYLTDLIRDCQILATLSIGGPAAAKVTNADVHPIKQATPAPSEEFMQRVCTMLAGTPPPWIKKILEKQA
ncbi:NifB/NifX family molybdenum-iron cluster-binding protein [Reinekea marinisedimentorum]|uniref:Nitrogen fixation protein NifX n=1 Tax=Reinekea marinisedimentorum TaxID=230495 RepID=A0A4R3I3U7_9GAMM|nr:NifB/NifX family molybdenum-iron cluster-binding protein [Reinekea marinisedimentorum]TCS39733.1 nitrogen fixation protein NifX [Reinekea marinisedimentorum]